MKKILVFSVKASSVLGSLEMSTEIGPVCRDPNDDHVIATALAVNAEVIVTGDKDLLALSQHQSIRILTARPFLTELGG